MLSHRPGMTDIILASQANAVRFAAMFVRLTRRKRVKAGWLVALLYLFCMLAPGAALALGSAASCVPTEIAPAAVTHEHAQPMHTANAAHDHGGHHADAGEPAHQQPTHRHDGKTSPGPCCAMLCLSAIAADLPAIAKPAQPISACVSESHRRLHGTAPPLLFRPPNA
jgi:hypothetical protein